MSLLGRRNLEVQVNEIIPENENYCMESYGDISLEEEIYLDQLALLESFHELDCIENAYYADRVLLESNFVDEEVQQERVVLLEADMEAGKGRTLDRIINAIRAIGSKIKGFFTSIINALSSKLSEVDRLVNKYGNLIKDQECELSIYEYPDVSTNNKHIKSLSAHQIHYILNSQIGGKLEAVVMNKSPEQLKEIKEKLENYRKTINKFNKEEIMNELRGEKKERRISGATAIATLKDKKIISDIKQEINAFDKACNEAIRSINSMKSKSRGMENASAVISVIGEYAKTFSSQANVMQKTAKTVIDAAKERYASMLHVAKKCVRSYQFDQTKEGRGTSEFMKKARDSVDAAAAYANAGAGAADSMDGFQEWINDLNDFFEKDRQKRDAEKQKNMNTIKNRHAAAAEEIKNSAAKARAESEKRNEANKKDFEQIDKDLDDLMK